MYEETAFFDPNSMDDEEHNDYFGTMSNEPDSVLLPNGNVANSDAIGSSSFGQNVVLPVEEFSYKCNLNQDNVIGEADVVTSVEEVQFQQQIAYELENCYNDVESNSLMQEAIHEVNQGLSYEHTNWVASSEYDVNGIFYGNDQNLQEHRMQQVEMIRNGEGSYSSSALLDVPYPSAPDLLNLLHLSRSPSSASLFPNSTISFSNASQSPSNFQNGVGLMDATSSSSILYDPLLHLNLPPQPPIFKDLFQSLPHHGLNLPVPMTGSLFARMDEIEHGIGMFHDMDGQLLDDGVLEFTADMPRMVKGRSGKIKPFATERDRRDNLNNKYTTLKSLIPSPKKTDRASIVEDAIEYIKELTRRINELKVLVEKKRCIKERKKRLRTEDTSPDQKTSDVNSNAEPNEPLRSSWLQRKSKDTEVDVRIIDDELTVKLSQRKKFNSLLTVSKILEEMQLDIQYVSGGLVGDFYSFLFNTKIGEASCVYSGRIANRLIEGVERQQAGLTVTTNNNSF